MSKRGCKKVDLTDFFEMGIDVEDLVSIKPMMLRRIADNLHSVLHWHCKYSLGQLVEWIAKIEAEDELRTTCKPLMIKLSKIARKELINVYDNEMREIRNKQRDARKRMEELKKIIDRHTLPYIYSEEEDEGEKTLRSGSVIELIPRCIPQC